MRRRKKKNSNWYFQPKVSRFLDRPVARHSTLVYRGSVFGAIRLPLSPGTPDLTDLLPTRLLIRLSSSLKSFVDKSAGSIIQRPIM